MRVALLEPYDTGSHGAWLRGWAQHSAHQLGLLTLTGQFWKWRMHGGAVTLARRYLEQGVGAEAIVATDMLDLSTFLALTRAQTHGAPCALYMHENQLTYPTRPGDKRDLHYGFINYASMLCARRVWFNSAYHLESWFDELPRLLKHFPDYNELPTVAALRARSSVLPLGLDLARLRALRPDRPRQGPPLILWNHRWEYDKNPTEFLRALYVLAERGLEFEVAILGEVFVRVPPEFEEARARLGGRIVQFGFVERYADYARWLWDADIVVSTALHDFFGAAVVEALACGCHPVLPDRLAYPQFIPAEQRAAVLYRSFEELVERLTRLVSGGPRLDLSAAVDCYDWPTVAPRYDAALEELVAVS
jgi:glycosyltransferase involved in cell wall biosynthesis